MCLHVLLFNSFPQKNRNNLIDSDCMPLLWGSRILRFVFLFLHIWGGQVKRITFWILNLIVTLTMSTNCCSYLTFFTILNSLIRIIVYSLLSFKTQNDWNMYNLHELSSLLVCVHCFPIRFLLNGFSTNSFAAMRLSRCY